jgi:APA family basic amino acid/polyamine antiporter
VLWTLGGVLAAINALSYVELATAIPRAGGTYEFVRRAYGPIAGVMTGWGAWLVLVTLQALLAVVVAEFLHRLGVLGGVDLSLVGTGVIVAFWALNWTSTRIAGDSQVAFSAVKGAALAALVVLLLAQPEHATTTVTSAGSVVGIAALAVALRNVVNTYNGWDEVVYFSEEMTSPERTIPRAVFGGIAGVTVLYVLVNVALLGVLSPADMAGSTLVAADAARIALGPVGDLAVTIFAVVSVAAITNLAIMKGSRISYALARAGQLPSKLGEVADTGVPRWALSASSLLAIGFVATGSYETIVAMNIPVGLVIVIAVNLAAIRLRRTEPDLVRPFRIPAFPLPPAIAIVLNAALLVALIYEDPMHSAAGLVTIAAIGVIYAVRGRRGGTAAARV